MCGNFGQVFRHKIGVLHEISLGETTILDFNWPVHKFKIFLQGYLLYFHCAVRTYNVRDLYMYVISSNRSYLRFSLGPPAYCLCGRVRSLVAFPWHHSFLRSVAFFLLGWLRVASLVLYIYSFLVLHVAYAYLPTCSYSGLIRPCASAYPAISAPMYIDVFSIWL